MIQLVQCNHSLCTLIPKSSVIKGAAFLAMVLESDWLVYIDPAHSYDHFKMQVATFAACETAVDRILTLFRTLIPCSQTGQYCVVVHPQQLVHPHKRVRPPPFLAAWLDLLWTDDIMTPFFAGDQQIALVGTLFQALFHLDLVGNKRKQARNTSVIAQDVLSALERCIVLQQQPQIGWPTELTSTIVRLQLIRQWRAMLFKWSGHILAQTSDSEMSNSKMNNSKMNNSKMYFYWKLFAYTAAMINTIPKSDFPTHFGHMLQQRHNDLTKLIETEYESRSDVDVMNVDDARNRGAIHYAKIARIVASTMQTIYNNASVFYSIVRQDLDEPMSRELTKYLVKTAHQLPTFLLTEDDRGVLAAFERIEMDAPTKLEYEVVGNKRRYRHKQCIQEQCIQQRCIQEIGFVVPFQTIPFRTTGVQGQAQWTVTQQQTLRWKHHIVPVPALYMYQMGANNPVDEVAFVYDGEPVAKLVTSSFWSSVTSPTKQTNYYLVHKDKWVPLLWDRVLISNGQLLTLLPSAIQKNDQTDQPQYHFEPIFETACARRRGHFHVRWLNRLKPSSAHVVTKLPTAPQQPNRPLYFNDESITEHEFFQTSSVHTPLVP